MPISLYCCLPACLPACPACPPLQAKEEMRAKEALLRNFFANVEVVLRQQKVATTAQRWEEEERALQRELDGVQRRVHEALCDNINTQVGAGGGLDRWDVWVVDLRG
jgi:hypothetical protein